MRYNTQFCLTLKYFNVIATVMKPVWYRSCSSFELKRKILEAKIVWINVRYKLKLLFFSKFTDKPIIILKAGSLRKHTSKFKEYFIFKLLLREGVCVSKWERGLCASEWVCMSVWEKTFFAGSSKLTLSLLN